MPPSSPRPRPRREMISAEIIISDDAELELIRNLVRLPDIRSEVERGLCPNKICDYLFEPSQKFNKVSELTGARCFHDIEGTYQRFCFCNYLYSIPVLRKLLGEQCRNARTQSQPPFTLFGYGRNTPIMYDLVRSQNCRKARIDVDQAYKLSLFSAVESFLLNSLRRRQFVATATGFNQPIILYS